MPAWFFNRTCIFKLRQKEKRFITCKLQVLSIGWNRILKGCKNLNMFAAHASNWQHLPTRFVCQSECCSWSRGHVTSIAPEWCSKIL
jgi:hypothetical protein